MLCKLCPRPNPEEVAVLPEAKINDSRISTSTKSGKAKATDLGNGKPPIKTFDEQNFSVSALPPTNLKDFGKPKYGLSKASWKLMVLSRLAVEDLTINILNLEVNLFPMVGALEKLLELSRLESIAEEVMPKDSLFRRPPTSTKDRVHSKSSFWNATSFEHELNEPKQSGSPISLRKRSKAKELAELDEQTFKALSLFVSD